MNSYGLVCWERFWGPVSNSTMVQKWCLPTSGNDNTAMNVSPHFRNLSDERLYTYMGKKKITDKFFFFPAQKEWIQAMQIYFRENAIDEPEFSAIKNAMWAPLPYKVNCTFTLRKCESIRWRTTQILKALVSLHHHKLLLQEAVSFIRACIKLAIWLCHGSVLSFCIFSPSHCNSDCRGKVQITSGKAW